jgi:hypothetical protein
VQVEDEAKKERKKIQPKEKIKTEKKEEEISANLAKKIHRKKIHSQPPVLHPFDFALGNVRITLDRFR